MQKTMITAATMFALLMSAGASMAEPLNGHSFGGKAHDVRASATQAFNTASQIAHTGSRHADMVGMEETSQGILQIYSIDSIADAVAIAQIIAPNAKATYQADPGFGLDQDSPSSTQPLGEEESKIIPAE